MTHWISRSETPADIPSIHDVHTAAFPTADEANLVEALRADSHAWINGLSIVTEDDDGFVAGHALLTRCHIGGQPALALAPCAVHPSYQRQGVGSATISAALASARDMGENTVVVLGDSEYYPRFGFMTASRFGIFAPFEVPDAAMMALGLDTDRGPAGGIIEYPAAFGA